MERSYGERTLGRYSSSSGSNSASLRRSGHRSQGQPQVSFISCQGCGHQLRHDLRQAFQPVGSVGTRCKQCKRRVCADCGCIWTRLHSCQLAAELVDERAKRLASLEFESFAAALGLKRCPACGSGCEKADPDACDHMTCVNCGHEFCWTCLADRTVILHHGNHYHMPDCRFNFGAGPIEFEAQCPMCRKRGSACRPPTSATSAHTATSGSMSTQALLSRASRWTAPPSVSPRGPPRPPLSMMSTSGMEVIDTNSVVNLDASHVERRLCHCTNHCPGQEWLIPPLLLKLLPRQG